MRMTEREGTGSPGRRRRPAVRSQSARSTARTAQHRRASLRPAGSDTRIDSAGAEESGWRNRGRRNTTVHRKSAAFLDVPEGFGEDEGSLRVRSFSFTTKGTGIINRGDSFRKKRSRSNSLAGGEPEPIPPAPSSVYRVAMLGSPGVGKTALVQQFMTSEAINPYDRVKDDANEESVYIMLNGEESELQFTTDLEVEKDGSSAAPADAYLVLYSVIDKASFEKAEVTLRRLQHIPLTRGTPVILVGNKVDLARSRAVSPQDGKCLACTFGTKFIEVSVGINHNVDELLVGILTQIRLRGANPVRELHRSHWYHSHGVVRASMKARQVFTWIFGKEDSKFKNCENLHVL